MCAYFQAKQTAMTFLAQICSKMDLGLKTRKSSVRIRINSRYYMCQFSGKMDNFDFFHPNLPNNGFWHLNFKYLSADLESATPRYHVCQFSVKLDSFEIFYLNLGKLSNYMRYFGSNNVLQRIKWRLKWAAWRLKWAGWRWFELGGGGSTV